MLSGQAETQRKTQFTLTFPNGVKMPNTAKRRE